MTDAALLAPNHEFHSPEFNSISDVATCAPLLIAWVRLAVSHDHWAQVLQATPVSLRNNLAPLRHPDGRFFAQCQMGTAVLG
jgi:hypothetical protein